MTRTSEEVLDYTAHPITFCDIYDLNMQAQQFSDNMKIAQYGSHQNLHQQLNDGSREIADQPRIEEEMSGPYFARPGPFYLPQTEGKWWSMSKQDFKALNDVARRNHTMFARIMETIWGVQLHGVDRCEYCNKKGHECWTFKPEAAPRIRNVGTRCARCQAERKIASCTLTKTFLATKDVPSIAPFDPKHRSGASAEQHGAVRDLYSQQNICEEDLNVLAAFGVTELDLQLTIDEQRSFEEGSFGNVEGLIAAPEFAKYF